MFCKVTFVANLWTLGKIVFYCIICETFMCCHFGQDSMEDEIFISVGLSW